MAIDVCSEISSAGISPRISFSHDLNQTDVLPNEDHHRHRRSDLTLLDSSSDFVFCIGSSFVQELSPADELFSDGKIRAKEIKQNVTNPDEIRGSEPVSSCTFKRSSSLNCDSSRSRSLIRSLHFLSRSNSTGSAPNSKPTPLSKETQKPHLQKQPSVSSRRSSSASCSSTYYYSYSSSQRPNGVRISPVLNLPPPYISKVTVSFFGFGSLFCNGKVKKKKK
ncbi:hypothetical protein SLA2020_454000 [Shorea laevis]